MIESIDFSDATSLFAARLRTEPSLPLAGFRVSHVGVLQGATGLFTSHRADPSWT